MKVAAVAAAITVAAATTAAGGGGGSSMGTASKRLHELPRGYMTPQQVKQQKKFPWTSSYLDHQEKIQDTRRLGLSISPNLVKKIPNVSAQRFVSWWFLM